MLDFRNTSNQKGWTNKMDMPEYQNHLICEVAKVNPNMVVVLHNGAPVTMPWVNQVKGILELYLQVKLPVRRLYGFYLVMSILPGILRRHFH